MLRWLAAQSFCKLRSVTSQGQWWLGAGSSLCKGVVPPGPLKPSPPMLTSSFELLYSTKHLKGRLSVSTWVTLFDPSSKRTLFGPDMLKAAVFQVFSKYCSRNCSQNVVVGSVDWAQICSPQSYCLSHQPLNFVRYFLSAY